MTDVMVAALRTELDRLIATGVETMLREMFPVVAKPPCPVMKHVAWEMMRERFKDSGALIEIPRCSGKLSEHIHLQPKEPSNDRLYPETTHRTFAYSR